MGKAEALPPGQHTLLLTGQGSHVQWRVVSCSEGLLNTSTKRLPSNNAQTPALVSVAAMEHLDQGKVKKGKLILAHGSSWIRVHDGEAEP